jgi:vacuolar protein sorting-associated protein 35
VDRVIGMAKLKLESALKANPDCILFGDTKKFLLELLMAPIKGYKDNILKLLQLPSSRESTQVEGHQKSIYLGGHFTEFLHLQPFGIRRRVAHEALSVLLKAHLENGYLLDSVVGINFLFGEMCNVLIRDQVDGTLFGPRKVNENDFKDEMTHLDWEDIIEEQTNIAKLIHMIKSVNDNFLENTLVAYVLD